MILTGPVAIISALFANPAILNPPSPPTQTQTNIQQPQMMMQTPEMTSDTKMSAMQMSGK